MCSFDDDNWVNIPNLYRVLSAYYRERSAEGISSYIGGVSGPFSKNIPSEKRIYFLTGGAGLCMSRDVIERGAANFTTLHDVCQSFQLPDDMSIGYLINHHLGVGQTEDPRFRSHLFEDQSHLSTYDIAKGVSFGYDNKRPRDIAARFEIRCCSGPFSFIWQLLETISPILSLRQWKHIQW